MSNEASMRAFSAIKLAVIVVNSKIQHWPNYLGRLQGFTLDAKLDAEWPEKRHLTILRGGSRGHDERLAVNAMIIRSLTVIAPSTIKSIRVSLR